MRSAIHIHHNQRKEALLKRFAVSLLICAFSVIMIAELSSALVIQFHSQRIQINVEDTPKLGNKTTFNRNHRQAVFDSFQPINGINFPRIFKKTAAASRLRFNSNSTSKPQKSRSGSRHYRQVRTGRTRLYHPDQRDWTRAVRISAYSIPS